MISHLNIFSFNISLTATWDEALKNVKEFVSSWSFVCMFCNYHQNNLLSVLDHFPVIGGTYQSGFHGSLKECCGKDFTILWVFYQMKHKCLSIKDDQKGFASILSMDIDWISFEFNFSANNDKLNLMLILLSSLAHAAQCTSTSILSMFPLKILTWTILSPSVLNFHCISELESAIKSIYF